MKFHPNTRKHFFAVRVLIRWYRLPRKVMESPLVEILKTQLAMALDNLLQLTCLSRALDWMTWRGPFPPKQSVPALVGLPTSPFAAFVLRGDPGGHHVLLLLQIGLAGGAAQVQHGARGPGEGVHRGLDVGVELLRVMARVVLRDDLLEEESPESEIRVGFCILFCWAHQGRASRRELGWFVPAGM